MHWPNWWKCKNSLYKIYPSSYSDELINLCWYCWGGGLYPYRLIFSSRLSEILTAGLRPWALVFIRTWSDLLLHKYPFARKPISSVFIICINRGIIYSVVLILTILFSHTNQLGKSLFVIIWFVYHGIYL